MAEGEWEKKTSRTAGEFLSLFLVRDDGVTGLARVFPAGSLAKSMIETQRPSYYPALGRFLKKSGSRPLPAYRDYLPDGVTTEEAEGRLREMMARTAARVTPPKVRRG